MKELQFNLNLPLWQITAGDFLDLLERGNKPVTIIDTTKDDRRFVYGLAGIADLFGCSKTTASRIKQSGKIDKAISQVGNIIVVDSEKAIALAGTVNGKHNKKEELWARKKKSKQI